MEYTIDDIWQLLAPEPKYFNRLRACTTMWEALPFEERKTIYARIEDKQTKGKFVDYNPYFAIVNNRPTAEVKEMSYNDYYKKYGTTEEVDGWKRVYKPEERTTVYYRH